MAPTLAPDDRALVVTKTRYSTGDVVVVEHPERPGYEMVKRVVAGPGEVVEGLALNDGEYWVEGDMPAASTDSRQFGPVRAEALKAKVVLVYGPKERRHLVR
jgi:nickel-type superoxide dismutase maturation protease